MKVIHISDYNPRMGKLIDIESYDLYKLNHIDGAINIPNDTLLYNKDRLLNKNDTYYIYCRGGHKSKRVVSILESYGFNVVQVLLK
ncbi:MAG: rhodanese-like domain-containing protein [Bacilli bacterium]|nr:rhodanese-like domain-containing protein [Bacilli bacterium]